MRNAYPPPPPSSRRRNAPTPPATADPDSAPTDVTSFADEAEGGEPTAGQGPVPDSLVPVRMTDLLDHPARDASTAKRTPRNVAIPVVGAFIAGAAVVLAFQGRLARADHVGASHDAPAGRLAEASRVTRISPERSSPARSVSSSALLEPPLGASAVFAARPAPVASSEPSRADDDRTASAPPSDVRTNLAVTAGVSTGAESEARAPAPAPSPSASVAEPAPSASAHTRRRKHRLPGATPEPPTAFFPD